MKFFLFTLFCVLLSGITYAQYYQGETSVYASGGVHYYVEHEEGTIFLSLAANGIIEQRPHADNSRYQDGTPFEAESGPIGTMQNRDLLMQAVRNAFTPTDIAMLKQEEDPTLLIFFAIVNNSYTAGSMGNVVELEFAFEGNTYFEFISPDKFFALEQEIKEKIKFILFRDSKPFTSYTMTSIVNFDFY